MDMNLPVPSRFHRAGTCIRLCLEAEQSSLRSFIPFNHVVAKDSCVAFRGDTFLPHTSRHAGHLRDLDWLTGPVLPLSIGVRECGAYLRSQHFGSSCLMLHESIIFASPAFTCTACQ